MVRQENKGTVTCTLQETTYPVWNAQTGLPFLPERWYLAPQFNEQ